MPAAQPGSPQDVANERNRNRAKARQQTQEQHSATLAGWPRPQALTQAMLDRAAADLRQQWINHINPGPFPHNAGNT